MKRHLFGGALTGAVYGLAILGLTIATLAVACSASQKAAEKSAATEALIIAADVCTEEAKDPNEPGWVRIACKVGGDVTRLIVSEATWATVQANASQTAASIRDGGS